MNKIQEENIHAHNHPKHETYTQPKIKNNFFIDKHSYPSNVGGHIQGEQNISIHVTPTYKHISMHIQIL